MILNSIENLPSGTFEESPEYLNADAQSCIEIIRRLPIELYQVIDKLSPGWESLSYREGGWNGRQIVHHIADSHSHAYIRIKWALSEDHPTIKPYDQDETANLKDYTERPAEQSLLFLEVLQARIAGLLESVEGPQWERTILHPEGNQVWTVLDLARDYAWHGRHHLWHLRSLRA